MLDRVGFVRRGIGWAAAATFSLMSGAAIAQMTPTASDIIFIVDESGSMGGEHTFLPGFVTNLDTELANRGVGTRSYGLTGYGGGGAGNSGRTFNVGAGLLGNAMEFGTAAGNLVLTGATEDGFAAIDFALNNYPGAAPGSSRTFVLVTDEDRDNTNPALDAAGITQALNAQGISLVVVVNGNIRGTNDEVALATDGTSAFVQQGNTTVAVPLGSTAGVGTTNADYILPALMTQNGCAADLNQLRGGGATAQAFAEIFGTCLVAAATGVAAPPPTANDLFLNVYRDSIYAIQMSLDNNLQQIIEIDLGSQLVQNALAAASNDAQIIDDILNIEGLRAYLVVDLMHGDFNRFGNNKRFDYDGFGTIVGVDYTTTNLLGMGEQTTFGGLLAYHSLSNDVKFPVGSLETDAYTGQLYAAVKMPEGVYAHVNAQVSFTHYDQKRIQGGTVFEADPNGFAFSADIEAGYESPKLMPIPGEPDLGVYLTPFVALGVDHRDVDGFQENNGGVKVQSWDDTSLTVKAGLRSTVTYDVPDDTTLFFRAKLAGLFDLMDDDQLVLINNGAAPLERIEAIDDALLQVGATVGANIGDQASLFFGWNGGFSAHTRQHVISGGAVVNF